MTDMDLISPDQRDVRPRRSRSDRRGCRGAGRAGRRHRPRGACASTGCCAAWPRRRPPARRRGRQPGLDVRPARRTAWPCWCTSMTSSASPRCGASPSATAGSAGPGSATTRSRSRPPSPWPSAASPGRTASTPAAGHRLHRRRGRAGRTARRPARLPGAGARGGAGPGGPRRRPRVHPGRRLTAGAAHGDGPGRPLVVGPGPAQRRARAGPAAARADRGGFGAVPGQRRPARRRNRGQRDRRTGQRGRRVALDRPGRAGPAGSRAGRPRGRRGPGPDGRAPRQPAGRAPSILAHPLVAAVQRARRSVGLPATTGDGSTDANAALAAGIPAVAIGCCDGENMHAPTERIRVASIDTGARQLTAVIAEFL